MRQLIATLVLIGAAGAAWGESSLMTELEVVATRYHEDPARLDTMRESLAQAAGATPEVDVLVALARVSFIWGDIRAATSEEKLEAYDQGRRAAMRALDRAPRDAAALLVRGEHRALGADEGHSALALSTLDDPGGDPDRHRAGSRLHRCLCACWQRLL